MTKIYTKQDIRDNFDDALSALSYGKISCIFAWELTHDDLLALMDIHRSGKHREKIEDLLTDCNYHTDCQNWHNGNYIILED